MARKKPLLLTLLDSARGLGLDKATVDKLEALNIPEVKSLSAKEIRAIRDRINASQGVFAALLNVNPSTIQKWEQGVVKPQNAALKLLHVLAKHGVEALMD